MFRLARGPRRCVFGGPEWKARVDPACKTFFSLSCDMQRHTCFSSDVERRLAQTWSARFPMVRGGAHTCLMKSSHETRLLMRPVKAPDGRKKGNSIDLWPRRLRMVSDVFEHWPRGYATVAFQWWLVGMRRFGLTRARLSCFYFFLKN